MIYLSKQIFMICNAHLDPVWQWQWEEGAAEAVSTFRVAADFCEQYDGFVFNHNEAVLYRWVEEYEPELFQRIKALVQKGKWHIMGGWYVQPDCNIPSGEGFVRQILAGHKYFQDKFGVIPRVAINFDPFGHSRGLVQILARSGYKGYMFCRPNGDVPGFPADLFIWKGFDGSEIMGQRMPQMYASGLGGAPDKVKGAIASCPENDFAPCLWGMGDHGGGPSRIDIEALDKLASELAPEVIIKHSTPDEFFSQVEKSGKKLPEFCGELNPWAVGCYTSQISVKMRYRQMENQLFSTERMCAAACAAGIMEYPKSELEEAQRDMLFCQFHDILPGSSIQPGEQDALRTLDHGLELLSRLRARAFFAFAAGQKKAQADEIPIMIYNPHPYEVEGDFECEMMLWGASFDQTFSAPQVYKDGQALPTQCEKEASNINLDWRKKVVFHAVLAPMQLNRFDCKYTRLERRPEIIAQDDHSHFYLNGKGIEIKINKNTGYIDSWISDGRQYLKAPISLDVISDSADPWEMSVNSINSVIGSFSLLSPGQSAELSGTDALLQAVRIIEDGPARTVAEAVLGYGRSGAVIHYIVSKRDGSVKIKLRLQWAETQRMAKLRIPAAIPDARCFGQTAYGLQELPVNGRENVSQKYILLEGGNAALAAVNNGIYGSCVQDGVLSLSLVRSAAYCAHPISGPVIPQDRFSPHMDIGERLYEFELRFGAPAEITADAPRMADVFNERPFALSFFPSGTDVQAHECALSVSGDKIQVPVYKQAEDGKGYILRLFNPFAKACGADIRSPLLEKGLSVSLAPYEIKTLRIYNGISEETDINENPLNK